MQFNSIKLALNEQNVDFFDKYYTYSVLPNVTLLYNYSPSTVNLFSAHYHNHYHNV